MNNLDGKLRELISEYVILGRLRGLEEAQKYAKELKGCDMSELYHDLKDCDVDEYIRNLHE